MRFVPILALATAGIAPSFGQTIEVPLASPVASVALGAGGLKPQVITQASSPTGKCLDNLQPGSYVEWRFVCDTPGLYSVRVWMAQWQEAGSVLAFETRPYSNPPDPYATAYATPDTRDYGQTLGQWAFHDLGPVKDRSGNVITVPLWTGFNILRLRNVTDRHFEALSYPVPPGEPHARPWGFYFSNIHVGRVTLTRVADLPPMGTVSGMVLADRPAQFPVPGAIVCANPVGGSPPEPSHFWRNGWFTQTRSDGTYLLSAPVGTMEMKAGRPSGYQVQGSAVYYADVSATEPRTANLGLKSRFPSAAAGSAAHIENVYADTFSGDLAILAVDGEGGYKVGWFDIGESSTMLVDAPVTGRYSVRSAYTNGGSFGNVRVSTDQNSVSDGQQPARTWGELQYADYPRPIFLRRGANSVRQTLITGNSDQNAIILTLLPTGISDAVAALRMAAGLNGTSATDILQYDLAGGDNRITLTDAVRVVQSAGL
jgi:hypothetical protein